MIEDNTPHKTLPGDFPVYHLFDNLFFCRYGSGIVHIAKFLPHVDWERVHRFFNSAGGANLNPLFEVRIPPEQWVSVVAEMSVPGKVNENHAVAQRLHVES